MTANPPLQDRYASVNGVRLHYVEAGEGPLVVLLHGFPEYWAGWRRQIPILVEAGFRVVAPDMRGYNLSEKPVGWRHYGRRQLGGDIAELIQHLGEDKAHVVGHDWGGAVAWYVAIDHPELVDRLAILNMPHPGAIAARGRNPRQLAKSWYVFAVNLPWLPERLVRARRWSLLRRGFERDARPGAFSQEAIEGYIEAWERPGVFPATLNYYRALVRDPRGQMSGGMRVAAPTAVIWGARDRYLSLPLARPPEKYVPNLELFEVLPEASHWVQHDEPDRVGQLLTGFLAG